MMRRPESEFVGLRGDAARLGHAPAMSDWIFHAPHGTWGGNLRNLFVTRHHFMHSLSHRAVAANVFAKGDWPKEWWRVFEKVAVGVTLSAPAHTYKKGPRNCVKTALSIRSAQSVAIVEHTTNLSARIHI